jgi:hypothetical protein
MFSGDAERRAADYLLVKKTGFPAYLGGVFSTGQARDHARSSGS